MARATEIYFHRGLNRQAPENTLAGFRRAVAAGATWIETDTDLIGDGTPIIMHDSRLDRTTNRSGSIYDITAEDLETIDAGSWFGEEFAGEPIPTLDQLIDFANETGVGIDLELKANEQGRDRSIELVEKVIERLGRLRPGVPVFVASFSQLLMAEFHRRCDEVPIALITTMERLGDDWRSILELSGASIVHPDQRSLTPADVEKLRNAGYDVTAWPCNDVRRANQLINWGCTGICSDVPDEMLHLANGR